MEGTCRAMTVVPPVDAGSHSSFPFAESGAVTGEPRAGVAYVQGAGFIEPLHQRASTPDNEGLP